MSPSKIFPAIFWLKLDKIPTLTRGCVRLKGNRSCRAWQHFTFPQVVRLLTCLTTWHVEHVWTILSLSLVSKWGFCPILLNIFAEKLRRQRAHGFVECASLWYTNVTSIPPWQHCGMGLFFIYRFTQCIVFKHKRYVMNVSPLFLRIKIIAFVLVNGGKKEEKTWWR